MKHKILPIFLMVIFILNVILIMAPNNQVSASESISLTATDDSFVTSQNSGYNAGSLGYVKMGVESGYYEWSYFKFDLSTYTGKTIVSATLKLYSPGGSYTWTEYIYPVSASWSESTITWGNKPANGASEINHYSESTSSGWRSIDVTTWVTNVCGGSVTDYGIVCKNDGAPYYRQYDSSEGTNKPKIDLVYENTGWMPSFTSTPIEWQKKGTTYSYQITTNESNQVTLVNAPSGFTMCHNGTTGAHFLNGTMPSTVGNYSVKIKAKSLTIELYRWQNFTLHSIPQNDYAPEVTGPIDILGSLTWYQKIVIKNLNPQWEIVGLAPDSHNYDLIIFLRDSSTKEIDDASVFYIDPGNYVITAFDIVVFGEESDKWYFDVMYYADATGVGLQLLTYYYDNGNIMHFVDSYQLFDRMDLSPTHITSERLSMPAKLHDTEYYNTNGRIGELIGEYLLFIGMHGTDGTYHIYPEIYVCDVAVKWDWDASKHQMNYSNVSHVVTLDGIYQNPDRKNNEVSGLALTTIYWAQTDYGTINYIGLFWTESISAAISISYYSFIDYDGSFTDNGTFNDNDDHFVFGNFDLEVNTAIGKTQFATNTTGYFIQDDGILSAGEKSECVLIQMNNRGSGTSQIYYFNGVYNSVFYYEEFGNGSGYEQTLHTYQMTTFRSGGFISINEIPNGLYGIGGFSSVLTHSRNMTRVFLYSTGYDSYFSQFNFYRYRIQIDSSSPSINYSTKSDWYVRQHIFKWGESTIFSLKLESVSHINKTAYGLGQNAPSFYFAYVPTTRMNGYANVEVITCNYSNGGTIKSYFTPSLVTYDYTNESNNSEVIVNITWISNLNITSYLTTDNYSWLTNSVIHIFITIPTSETSIMMMGLIWLIIVFLPAIALNIVIPRIGFIGGILLMTIILGLTMPNFFFITIIALIGCGFVFIRGD